MPKSAPHLNPWAWVPTLYFIEGLPSMMVNTIAVLLYTDMGVSLTEMTFYTSLLSFPWVFKFAWSPFVDILRTKRWWTVTMQALIGIVLLLLAFAIPTSFYFTATLILFWITAFASATHDIAADGFYMLALDQNKQSFFVGIRSTFYRFAMIFGNGVLVVLAGRLERSTESAATAWQIIFQIAAAIMCVGAVYHHFILPRPVHNDAVKAVTIKQTAREFGATLTTFCRKKGLLVALLFLLLYRLPEALLLKLVYPFLQDPEAKGGLELSKETIGTAYGVVGIIGLLGGGIIGGWLGARYGLKRWIKPMAIAMSLSCLPFLVLTSFEQPHILLVNVCIFVEQFGYGFGFSAYMLYMLYFARGEYATSHYAICTGFMAASIMLPGMAAGWLCEQLGGYHNYFIFCVCTCVVTILVASIVKIDGDFGKKQKTEKLK